MPAAAALAAAPASAPVSASASAALALLKAEENAPPEKPLTEKQLIGLHKTKNQRTSFLQFLLRRVAGVTYQYNCMEDKQLVDFCKAFEAADVFRAGMPKKKSEIPRVWCLKVLLDTANAMAAREQLEHATILRNFVNMSARLRVITGVAAEFIKILEKSGCDPDFLFKAKFYLDHWKGFCVRTYDFAPTPVANPQLLDVPEEILSDSDTMTLLVKYLPWLLTVRTALFAAGQYLRRVSLAADIKLFPTDPTEFRKFMNSEDFVTAYNIDDALFQRSQEKRLSKMFGIKQPEVTVWTLPKLADVNPKLITCIDENGILLSFPAEPFVEKKKKGKGKGKDKGKGKKR